MVHKKHTEELLALLFKQRDLQEEVVRKQLVRFPDMDCDELVRHVVNAELVKRENGTLSLTAAGEGLARQVVRREGLAERLLKDLLSVSDEAWQSTACEFEHILSEEVADSVCTLLGHPPLCPHGQPIPPGKCCEMRSREIFPVVVPLTETRVGGSARIMFMGTQHHARIDKLANLGVVPGCTIRLHQKQPSYVIQCGETSVALDEEIARDIFVKRVDVSAS